MGRHELANGQAVGAVLGQQGGRLRGAARAEVGGTKEEARPTEERPQC